MIIMIVVVLVVRMIMGSHDYGNYYVCSNVRF